MADELVYGEKRFPAVHYGYIEHLRSLLGPDGVKYGGEVILPKPMPIPA
jgi:hypothetical protein